jgi:glycosyltransferase involved in cell wall biosynthesis
MRVAYLTPEFVTEAKFDGGLGNYLNRVTRALAEYGHEPEVFVLSDRDESFDFDGVRVHRVGQRFGNGIRWLRRAGRVLCRSDMNMTSLVLSGSRRLAERFVQRQRERPFDIVQGSDFYATALNVPRRSGVVTITRLSYYAPLARTAYEAALTVDRFAMESFERWVMHRSDFLYAPSSSMARYISTRLGLRVDIVHPPAFVELDEGVEDPGLADRLVGDRRFVLFFGRICRLKGVYSLVEAMREVMRSDPTVHLAIVGREDPPGILEDLRGLMADVAPRLIHSTRLPHAQLYPVVRRAAAVALPSRADNFPNACLEAMALGRPVIGTRDTGFEDLIVDGRSGFLVDRDAPDQIAARVRRILGLSVPELDALGRAARERAAEFSPARTIPRLIDYYENCLTGATPPSR